MFKKLLLTGMIVGTIGSICAFADRHDVSYNFNWHVDKLMARIDQGVKNGQLSRREAVHLRQEVRAVERERIKMLRRNDGELSPRQRRILESDMETVNHDVYREKHDGDYVQPAPGSHDKVSLRINIPSNGTPSGSLRVVAH